METLKANKERLFQMLPIGNVPNVKGNVFNKGRILVGRTESCDFVIPSGVVSAVHAVIEITSKGCKIYDMNSKNGVFVNGEKVVAVDIKVGDEVSFGNITFKFKEYVSATDLPPVLDLLEPKQGVASVHKSEEPLPAPPSELPKAPVVEEEGPYIVYPLSSDPKADYSEYIFEDEADLYPIFKYDHSKQAVEIIILFKDKVYSVDYLPEKNGVYSIVGSNPKGGEIEFAYLGKTEKMPFVEISNGNCVISTLPGYETFHLTDKGMNKAQDRVNVANDDIVRLVNGDLEIYARKVSSPPKVKPAPLFGRDNAVKKYFALTLLILLLPLIGLAFFYDVDEEMKKEKDPERIATILYKQPLVITKNKTVEKTKKAPPKKQKTPKKTVVKKSKPKKPAQPQKKPETKKVAKKDPGSKKAPKKQIVKKVRKPRPKKSATVAKSAASAASAKSASSAKSVVRRKTVGTVDVYKSADFKSSISSLMAKGGSLKGAKVAASKSSNNLGGATVGGGVASNLRKADVGTEIGSLTGAAAGKLAQSKGAEGLSAKKGIYTAGIPSETVVLGSMDPDVIRRILREHIPQFRYCYQKELDRGNRKTLSGTIGLQFTIGASGHVSRAGVSNRTQLPSNVKRCVVNVLRGIQFPSPLGGGTVEVKQPFNFYPKRL
ncbi:MAG: FHA domain-containing protein [Bacteriovoracaceae bacterium]|nr:FHA domain-containing protein [Bacteriovoracaceae bacterium]